MKQFLIKITLFAFAVGLSILLVFSMADGYSDALYMRFATSQKQSLILGTSRAAQGLIPSEIAKIISPSNSMGEFYNYGFSITHSPWGPTYLASIKKKIRPATKDAIYILAVDPWTLSSTTKNPDDSSHFEELDHAVANVQAVNMNPNLFYLTNYYFDPYVYILWRKWIHPRGFINNDGWLEISIEMDSASVKEREDRLITNYTNNNLVRYHFSDLRFVYLEKTIDFLKTHGKVYLVRMPLHRRMFEIEQKLMPNFESLINSLCVTMKVDYFNYVDELNTYKFTDGNHLYKTSAKKLSIDLAKRIANSAR